MKKIRPNGFSDGKFGTGMELDEIMNRERGGNGWKVNGLRVC
jgi:hypothetical protein